MRADYSLKSTRSIAIAAAQNLAGVRAVILEQGAGELPAGPEVGQGDVDLVAAVVDDAPAAQLHRVLRHADDHLALLRLAGLHQGKGEQALGCTLRGLDGEVARKLERLLGQERGGRPADRPLAEIAVGRVPHRDLRAVRHDLELRRGVVLEAHAARPADIERALHDAAVGIALHEARLRRADRIDVAFDVRDAGLSLCLILGLGPAGGEGESENGGKGGEERAHGAAYDARLRLFQVSGSSSQGCEQPFTLRQQREEPSMHVGMATVFQNTGRAVSDRQIYLNELALADMAEPLGFESIWSVEHHFTDYTMCPDVVQFLSYMAGRTRNLKLGSMVVVLPWHDPM